MNDMNDKFVDKLLALAVQLQRRGATNGEILARLAQFRRDLDAEKAIEYLSLTNEASKC